MKIVFALKDVDGRWKKLKEGDNKFSFVVRKLF